jgi:hypothetical protein
VFTPRPLYPLERASGTHWIGGSVDLRTGVDAPDPSAAQHIASRSTDCGITSLRQRNKESTLWNKETWG